MGLPLDCFVAASRLRGYVEPAFAGRSAFDVDAALGSLLAMTVEEARGQYFATNGAGAKLSNL
ncbi:MAG: hypothetical protein ACR2KT_15135 [Methylocella sp.]